MSRLLVVLAALTATAAGACTHTHQVATPGPLPEPSVDHLRGALEGAGLGLVGGGVAGVAAAVIDGDDPECEELFCVALTAREKAVVYGITGAGIGAATGLVFGAIIGSRDFYERAPGWVPAVSGHVGPQSAGARASWSF